MIKLYHTNCPVCKGIELALKRKNIEYTECTNVQEMIERGITNTPVLEVDGKFYRGGKDCLNFVNSYEVK